MGYNPNFRGNTANASARQTTTGYVNASGGVIAQCSPVSINGSGQILLVDPSSESSVDAMVGLASVNIPNGANGPVTDCGRLENANISFPVGSPLYVSLSGFLQTDKPDIGIDGFSSGDFVIFVGVVVENEFNPANKDIKLMLTLVGQL